LCYAAAQGKTAPYRNDALRLMSERGAMFDEWLRGEVVAALSDKRPPVPIKDVFKRLEARHNRRVRAKVNASIASKKPAVPIDDAFERARAAIARKEKAAKKTAKHGA
jgi:hypothetical protein